MKLRPPEERDIPALLELMTRPRVQRNTLRMPFTDEGFIRERVMRRDPMVTSVIAEVDGVARGWATLMRQQNRESHMATVALAVHDDFARQGIGQGLMEALLDVADNWLGLRRVYLFVTADNAPAITLYEKLGFEQEGRLRADVMREGQLVDSLVMGRLRGPMPYEGGA